MNRHVVSCKTDLNVWVQEDTNICEDYLKTTRLITLCLTFTINVSENGAPQMGRPHTIRTNELSQLMNGLDLRKTNIGTGWIFLDGADKAVAITL